MSSSEIIISSKMVEAMGKINDNDFIPILKAFNLQGFEMKVVFSNNLEEYKKGNKVVVESAIKYFVKS